MPSPDESDSSDDADSSGATSDDTSSDAASNDAATGGDALAEDEQYCPSCGAVIKRAAEICPECGVRQQPPATEYEKDRVTAGVLAILLGWAGVHRFYLGDTGLGLLYLCFFWTGIPALVGLVEGILYLTKTDAEFQRRYVD